MVRKKQIDIKIKIAIISGIFLVIAYTASAYLQSPLADTQFQERPIIGVSFADWTNHEYPKESLESDGSNYFIKILAQNNGNSKGKIFVTITSTNAKVSFYENGEFTNRQSLHYNINPLTNYTTLSPPIFIKPDQNIPRFSVEFTAQNSVNQNPFQELDLLIPTQLIYEFGNEGFKLVDRK